MEDRIMKKNTRELDEKELEQVSGGAPSGAQLGSLQIVDLESTGLVYPEPHGPDGTCFPDCSDPR